MKLLSPLKGWVAPLDEVSDAVFAGRMLGDGVAIDPTDGMLLAPCDAEVVSIARTRHAVTLRTVEGAELLIHIGLDTVALEGEGFEAHVRPGQTVKVGTPLIRFDLDQVARRARSLITPILVTNTEAFRIVSRRCDCEVEAGELLMALSPVGANLAVEAAGGPALERIVVLGFPHGLHARPAAHVAGLAKRFPADMAIIAKGARANAKSPISLMTLGAAYGEALTVSARGNGAAEALDALAAFLGGDGGDVAEMAWTVFATLPAASPVKGVLKGVCAAPGRVVGATFRFQRAEIVVAGESHGMAREAASLNDALARVKTEIASSAHGHESAEIMAAHLALIEDETLIAAAHGGIAAGKGAGRAWRDAVEAQVAALRALSDPRLRERAADLEDLKRRGLIALGGEAKAPCAPPGSVLLADDLLPSELLALSGVIAGLCTAGGGPTSHVAIIAASLDIPAVVAAGQGVLTVADGTMAVLDGSTGVLQLDLPADILEREPLDAEAASVAKAAVRAAAADPAHLRSGERIEVFANLGGGVGEAAEAVASGAEGCGLLRSEFLFMDRADPPDEDEQHAAYQAIADVLDGRPLIIRTLDIGGDKQAAYLALPREENPALGLRGVRTSLWRPEVLRTQLRAILRVRPLGVCKIMVPMVTSPHELTAVREMLETEMRALGVTGEIKLGVMIETPAAAVTARAIAKVADFFSIGTNDLTQYALAMDRGNPLVASQLDPLHPAVLRLIALACEGAREERRRVGVCGGLASEPLAAAVLVGLGVTELSATAKVLPALKARLRGLTLEDCRRAAETVLSCASAGEARARLVELHRSLVAAAEAVL